MKNNSANDPDNEDAIPASDDWHEDDMAQGHAFSKARDPEMLPNLFTLGRTMTAERLEELLSKVDDGNSEQICFAAHTSKSACGTVFVELAPEIEQNNANI
ncbi:MAG: hypothetical protein OSB69_18755 [Alphaproteobacteria bacterium]|nr:hypothetical protein [Alphaproteobacteria bacterium]